MYSDEPRASEHKAGRERRTLTMNLNVNNQPLIPAFSPYEGEKENVSPVVEHASGLDFRGVGKRAVRGCRGSPGSAGPALENSL